MSAVAHLPPDFVDARVRTRCVRAWTGLNRRHGLALALGTLLVAVHDISLLADKLARPGVGKIIVFDLFSTIVLFSITLLVWSAATYGHAPTGPARNRAIALAIVVSGVLASLVIVPLMKSIGIAELWSDVIGSKRPLPPLWIGILGNTFHLGLFSFLFVVAIEILHRRAATMSAIHASQQEQSSIARAGLESRLAAMQAQVEPQFLFNALVAIEALYQRNAGAAAEQSRPADPVPESGAATPARAGFHGRRGTRPRARVSGGRHVPARRAAGPHGDRRRPLRRRPLLPDAAAAADPAGGARTGRASCPSRSVSACRRSATTSSS